eukprot:8499995-Pyramimonas_sp.AAC.1
MPPVGLGPLGPRTARDPGVARPWTGGRRVPFDRISGPRLPAESRPPQGAALSGAPGPIGIRRGKNTQTQSA